MDTPHSMPRHQTDLDQMLYDIVQAAKIAEVTCDNDAIQRVLNAYRDSFSGASVSFATNTKPIGDRGLSIRYVDFEFPHDPYKIALDNGFVIESDHPIESFLAEIRSKFTIQGYGVDLSATNGFAKIWVFFRDLPSVKDVCTITSLPESIISHARFFEKYDLAYVSLFALDFLHKSINIYFMAKKPGLFPTDKIARMVEELDLEIPNQELLEHSSKAVTIYPTFNWDSPNAERICFGTIVPNPDLVPRHLHSLLEQYVSQVPFASDHRIFIYSITPARSGDYIKIENDYTGSMTELMRGGIQAVP